MDPEKLTAQEGMARPARSGGERVESEHERACAGDWKNRAGSALCEGAFNGCAALDAKYVRRPDAEVFWKGRTSRGS